MVVNSEIRRFDNYRPFKNVTDPNIVNRVEINQLNRALVSLTTKLAPRQELKGKSLSEEVNRRKL